VTVLALSEVRLSLGGSEVLCGAALEVQAGERVALVGPNGAGKSSLLRVATGEWQADAGQRMLRKGARIGYLTQHPLSGERTVWQEARAVFAVADEWERRTTELRAQMALATDEDALAALARLSEEAQRSFEQLGGYAIPAMVRRVLHGMAFPEPLHELPVTALSGGQKTRLQLVKLLLQEPDLLVLDEPTNYLDMDTVQWLESYLENYRSALLVVSHDRYFLDRVTTITYELTRGRTLRFPAPYSAFAEWKEQEQDRQTDAFDEQQALIAKMEDFIARNLVRATTTKRAQSRRKALAKIERLERPDSVKAAVLRFPISKESGRDVLALRAVTITRGTRNLFAPLTLALYRGERIALLGPNGVGKTSLLRALAGQLPYDGGIRLGQHVQLAYFAQELEGVDGEESVLHHLWNSYPTRTETEIRNRLGQVLFRGEDVYKSCSVLSGGEKSRLALAKLAMQEANFLLLDEPTNHLDLPAKEVLEEALLDYSGTLLFVSHDRYFINRVATRILSLSPDGLSDIPGDYDDWLASQRALSLAKREMADLAQDERSDNQVDWEQRKRQRTEERRQKERLQKVEQQVAASEERKTALEAQLADNATYEDRLLTDRLQSEYTATQEQLDELYAEWAELAAALDQ